MSFRGVPSSGGWLPGAEFEFKRSWFHSFITYEQRVMWNLRLLQRMRWLLRHRPAEAQALLAPDLQMGDGALASLEWKIKDELWEVRWAVDDELEERPGKAYVVAALRALPERPDSAIEYPDVAAFVNQDPRRGISDAPEPALRVGMAFGYHWQLENPFRRWETSNWHISWLCDHRRALISDEDWIPDEEIDVTDEVYACEQSEGKQDGRVWLLGTIHFRAAIEQALDEMRLHAISHRNSLVAAADAVAKAERQSGAR